MLSKLKQKARHLKSEAQVLMVAYKDKRTPVTDKNINRHNCRIFIQSCCFNTRLYAVLGLLDDLIIVPVLITLSIKLIPEIVLKEARENLANDPLRYKKIIGSLLV